MNSLAGEHVGFHELLPRMPRLQQKNSGCRFSGRRASGENTLTVDYEYDSNRGAVDYCHEPLRTSLRRSVNAKLLPLDLRGARNSSDFFYIIVATHLAAPITLVSAHDASL